MNDLNFFGEKATFDHIGLIVKSISKTHPGINIIYDKNQHVNLAFTKINGVTFEYIEPIDINSPVYKLVNNNLKIAHICYQVENIKESISLAKQHKFLLIRKPMEAHAFNNRKVCFLHNKFYGVIELLEQ